MVSSYRGIIVTRRPKFGKRYLKEYSVIKRGFLISEMRIDEEEIKIVVLGDPGVGKTSLILNIVTEKFNPNPPKVRQKLFKIFNEH